MATYEYRCRDCGRFEVRLPIGTASAVFDCPECRSPASRVFSSPYLSQVSPTTARARSREEQSREAPEVVTSVPAPRRRQPPHPALQRLPRP
ncbi:zinc ribbon domain-containing protein [Nonomuraea sp. SMC257]|uniref:Zinc ribbon domain-containing protein n=1 Tax=Nonomuraea montanisoli TaxID=2741721 RepID=A0A7Y6IAP1_9ACTN|nr:zinc ribbon domain-containing protein [Nonomuraea montanisoli]NUW33459.1 zinc ribbon domain-containing protein [Nonomuraea montanisoli]